MRIFIAVGLMSGVASFVFDSLSGLTFFGIMFLFFGGLIAVFGARNKLIITDDKIVFTSENLVKDFNKTVVVDLAELEHVDFLKRQFLILGGRNPLADADAQTMFNQNRMVFYLRHKRPVVINQVGKPGEF